MVCEWLGSRHWLPQAGLAAVEEARDSGVSAEPPALLYLLGFLLRVPLPNEWAIPICLQVHRHPPKGHKPSAHLYKKHGGSSCGHRRLRLNVNPRAKTWIHFSSWPRENLPGERGPWAYLYTYHHTTWRRAGNTVAAFIAFQGEQASSRPTPSGVSRLGTQEEQGAGLSTAIPWEPINEVLELELQD